MKEHPIGKEFNVAYFRNLIAVAMADGILRDEEKAFFKAKAQELGLSTDNIEDILLMPDHELIAQSNDAIDEDGFLMDLVAMSMVDGEIHENEYNLCLQLAEKQGLEKEDVDDTIRLLQNLLNTSNE